MKRLEQSLLKVRKTRARSTSLRSVMRHIVVVDDVWFSDI